MQLTTGTLGLRHKSRRWFCFAALLVSVVVTISTITEVPAHAAFPGRNGRIVYTNTIGGGDVGRNQIFTIRPNGTGRQRLTRHGQSDSPDWAPNGHRIVYRHWSRDGNSSIWIMG